MAWSLGIDHINLLANSGSDVLIFRNIGNAPVDNPDTVTNFSAFDAIDVGELVPSIALGGNFSSQSAGLASLSTTNSFAFFRTDLHVLFIDVNHDGAIDVEHDMSVLLEGVSSINKWNLVA